MSRARKNQSRALVGNLAIALLALACSSKPAPQSESRSSGKYGEVALDLSFLAAQGANAVDYQVTGRNRGFQSAGTIHFDELQAGFSFGLYSLEPDTYDITLSTTLADGRKCSGTDSVTVGRGMEVAARIVMQCQDGNGSISVEGELDIGSSQSAAIGAPSTGPLTPALPATSASTGGAVAPSASSDLGADATAPGAAPSADGGCLEADGAAPCAADAAAPSEAGLASDGGAPMASAAPSTPTTADTCAACTQNACASERAACDASADCLAVEQCVYESRCIYERRSGSQAGLWDACLCGIGSDVDTCYFEDAPALGPCAAEMQRAAGAADNLSIGVTYYDETTAQGLAGWLQYCQANSCGAQCGY